MPSITETFIEGLRAGIKEKSLPKFWGSFKEIDTFQDALEQYDQYYKTLNPIQQKTISEIFWNQIKILEPSIIKDLSNDEIKSIQSLVEKILDGANIPALSMSWQKANNNKTFAFGIADTSTKKSVDSATLFQASSLSKPVSAAIVLDLMEQNNWKSDTRLADLADYGPPELKADPRYRELTIGMVLGQCSGLPNVVKSDDEKKFMVTPGVQFDYSGLAFDFLKEVIEKKLKKNWEELAQEFFKKVGMQNSTFKQLPVSHLHGKRDTAHGHKENGTPAELTFPPDTIDPAGYLLTTANDFMIFLQYCYNNKFLKSTLLTGVYKLNKEFPEDVRDVTRQILWGLGMGVYTDKDKTIAFHWGNNLGWNSFCAINIKTGDALACFVNSDNRIVIQQLAESVVGDMAPLFQWLRYCNFKAEEAPNTSISITALFPLMDALAKKGLEQHYEATHTQSSETTQITDTIHPKP